MLPPTRWARFVVSTLSVLLASTLATAYEVPVSDADYDRQICSGMWGSSNTFINGAPGTRVFVHRNQTSLLVVTFDSSSQGQLAMVIYEWKDMQYLGKVTSMVDDMLPVSDPSRVPTCLRYLTHCSRRHTYARPTLSEVASATTHSSAASSSTSQKGSP